MEQIIPNNENYEYFDEDEVDKWSSIEDSMEWGTLEDLRDALNCWVDDIYDKGIPEDTKLQHTIVDGKLYIKMHSVFMSRTEREGKQDFFMTVEQIDGEE